MTPEAAYEEICRIARAHALVLQAFGGVVTIVHPDTQKSEGLYERIQWIHGLGPCPQEEAKPKSEPEQHTLLDEADA